MSITVQNSFGQIVNQAQLIENPGNSSIQLLTSEWVPGTYFIRFETEDGIHTERLLISR